MITSIAKSSINFKANYNLISDDSYKSMIAKRNHDIMHSLIPFQQSKNIIQGNPRAGYKISEAKNALSTGFIMCNGIGFSDSDKITLNHIVPNQDDDAFFKTIETSINADYDAILKSNKPVDILVTGGKTFDKKSVALFNYTLPVIKNKKADTTVLWGLKGGNIMNLLYSGEIDTFSIHIPKLNLEKINSLKDFSEHIFEIVQPGIRTKFFNQGKRIF